MVSEIDYWRTPIRWVHGIWALFCGAVCALLVLAGGGHPPPIVFVPVVLAVWLAGHLALWTVRWLAIRGRRGAARYGLDSLAWPPGLVLATVGAGIVFLLGLLQLAVSSALQRPYPYRGLLWAVTVAVWVLHSICFVGLMLRRSWSRLLTVGLCFAWAAYLAWLAIEGLVTRVAEPLEFLFVLALATTTAFLGHHFLSSRRVKEFLLRTRTSR